jgi:hypothetical protein
MKSARNTYFKNSLKKGPNREKRNINGSIKKGKKPTKHSKKKGKKPISVKGRARAREERGSKKDVNLVLYAKCIKKLWDNLNELEMQGYYHSVATDSSDIELTYQVESVLTDLNKLISLDKTSMTPDFIKALAECSVTDLNTLVCLPSTIDRNTILDTLLLQYKDISLKSANTLELQPSRLLYLVVVLLCQVYCNDNDMREFYLEHTFSITKQNNQLGIHFIGGNNWLEGDGNIYVSRMLPRGAAKKAGIHVGDHILKIGSTSFNKLTHEAAIKAIRKSKPETTITVRRFKFFEEYSVLMERMVEVLNKKKKYTLLNKVYKHLYGILAVFFPVIVPPYPSKSRTRELTSHIKKNKWTSHFAKYKWPEFKQWHQPRELQLVRQRHSTQSESDLERTPTPPPTYSELGLHNTEELLPNYSAAQRLISHNDQTPLLGFPTSVLEYSTDATA